MPSFKGEDPNKTLKDIKDYKKNYIDKITNAIARDFFLTFYKI